MSLNQRLKKLESRLALQGEKMLFPIIINDTYLEKSEQEIRAIEDEELEAAGLTRRECEVMRIIVYVPYFPPHHPRFKDEPYDPLPGCTELSAKEKAAFIRRHDAFEAKRAR